MTPERHALIKEIFLAAVASPPAEREAILKKRCGDDNELRVEAERLIEHFVETASSPDAAGTETLDTDAWRRGGQQLDLDVGGPAAPPKSSPQEDADDDAHLLAGQVVAERYRIVSQLGQGGMGVVYRAEDLTLGQTVALKFLRPEMAQRATWLARFRSEARVARGVTHVNVCRMYDIGEADGRTFLSMEYVDGEDLSTLFRRIGRLPNEKALDIARQLCIGLAAAHGAGILHRDLKPANVMLDGRGQVRITDFGLAMPPELIEARDVRAGTPAYMAPEQIDGQEVSIQSDIYALGLVIYELFAGRPAFEANSIAGYAELHRNGRPTPLSDIVPEVDPAVERIIEQCLRKHAHDRPVSALAVATALPGTDALAVALAANQTPSPATVASANPKGAHPTANRLLFTAIALVFGALVLRSEAPFGWEIPQNKSPTVLAEISRYIVQATGHGSVGSYSEFGFCRVDEAAVLLGGRLKQPSNEFDLATSTGTDLLFWFRQSAHRLIPSDADNLMINDGRVTLADPSPLAPGMVSVVLEPSGRLLLFSASPSAVDHDASYADPPSAGPWNALLRSAFLQEPNLVTVEPSKKSFLREDQRFAWRATDATGSFIRLDAATEGGKPVFFSVGRAEQSAAATGPLDDVRLRRKIASTTRRLLLFSVALVAIPWAWRNHWSGRSDRKGTVRLAAIVFASCMIVWLLRAKHTPWFNLELSRLCLAIARALGVAALVAVFYDALEPYARRHWPQMLITWSRALSGDLRNALVGEHVLIGVCVGSAWAVITACERVVVMVLGLTARSSVISDRVADKIVGGRIALGSYVNALPRAIVLGLLLLLLLAVLRSYLRSPRLAALLSALILLPLIMPSAAHQYTAWLFFGIGGIGIIVWTMARYGLLALVTAMFVASALNTSPMTLHVSAWYWDLTFYALLIVGAIAVYGFTVARRGESSVPAVAT